MEQRDAIDVLACDIEARPPGAPGIDALAPHVRDVERDGGHTLTVSFDPAAFGEVEAFAEAERACCSTLQWTVERDEGAVRLIVAAAPEQIDLLEALFHEGR